jgi:multidrug resistance protein, MATE family
MLLNGLQAYGAEQFDRLSIIFQRTCLFLAVHLAPILAIVLSAPSVLAWAGQRPDVCRLMLPYILISLPGLVLDVVDRPMNRILVAQQITTPQMWISGVGAPFLALTRHFPRLDLHSA